MWFWIRMVGDLDADIRALVLAGLAAGVLLAIVTLRPGPLGRGSELTARIALWRFLIGFGFVLVLSWPYLSTMDTADAALGGFNVSIAVGAAVTLVALAVLSSRLTGSALERLEKQRGKIRARIGVTAVLYPMIVYLVVTQPHSELTHLRIFLTAAGIAFYLPSTWLISRWWFGLSGAHPVLGPVVTAVTVTAVTAIGLFKDGPGVLPVPHWLLINLAGLTTTLGLCAWEWVDYRSAVRGTDPGPAATGVIVAVALVLAAGAFFVLSGAAQPAVCRRPSIVNCDRSDDRPPTAQASPVPFELAALDGLDLNGDDAGDLFYDNREALGNRLYPGENVILAWTRPGPLPGRDECDLAMRRSRPPRSVQPQDGLVLCMTTTAGRRATVVISHVEYRYVAGTATVWS